MKYLEEYGKRLHYDKVVPQLVDILNCHSGCNHGTGTDRNIPLDDIDCKINAMKKNFLGHSKQKTSSEEIINSPIHHNPKNNPLFGMFDEQLN